MSIKVFIVDDHGLVRAGFRMILSREVDIEVVGEAESAEDALPQIRRLAPDVVLCDLHLPGLSGIELVERVVRGDCASRIVMVSVLEDGPLPRRVLEAGASCYVGKACDVAEPQEIAVAKQRPAENPAKAGVRKREYVNSVEASGSVSRR